MSYLGFHKLKEPPFANVPDLRFFYTSPHYVESFDKLVNSIEDGKQLITVIGRCGLGKTVISRKILSLFENKESEYEILLLVCIHSDMAAGWFLHRLALQLHIELSKDDKSGLFEAVGRRLGKFGDENKQVIILIDEANMIENIEVYEEVRGLIDFMSDNKQKFSVVLFGLQTLGDKLATSEPIFQRVETRIVLKPFPTTNETRDYIRHRLKVAGAQNDIFDDTAYRIIHYSSKGNPRLINIICDNAFTEGYLMKQKVITEKEVNRVIVEMGYNTRLKTLFMDT